jgi:heme/copper-type cytochrome/quinol oxidase subunit 3
MFNIFRIDTYHLQSPQKMLKLLLLLDDILLVSSFSCLLKDHGFDRNNRRRPRVALLQEMHMAALGGQHK